MNAQDSAMKNDPAGFKAWWILSILFLLYVFSFIDRHIIAMLVPDIQQSFGLSDAQIGLVLGPAFVISYSLFGIPLGWAADRFSRRWIIFLGALVFGLATAASALASTFAALVLARVFVGIGEASLSPAAYSLMADSFPKKRLGTASAVYNTAAKIGTSAAFFLGGLLIGLAASWQLAKPDGELIEPWRIVFVCAGLPVMLLAVLMFTFAEPERRQPASSSDAGKSGILQFLMQKRRLMIPFLTGFSLMAICSFALVAWAPTYLARKFAMTPDQYGPLLGVVSLVAAATLIFKGAIIDWLFAKGGKDAHVRFYTWILLPTIPVAFFMFATGDPLIFIACYGIVQVVALPTIVFMTAAIQVFVPGNIRGQMIAVCLLCLSVIGGTIGPTIVGVLTDSVFKDPAKIGSSLSIVLCTIFPVAFVLLRMSLKPLRLVIEEAERQDSQPTGAFRSDEAVGEKGLSPVNS